MTATLVPASDLIAQGFAAGVTLLVFLWGMSIVIRKLTNWLDL